MKQTNNAIKFLVAQYRAIFKNAYVKGLASAAVLTAALAAGQANAAGKVDGAWDLEDFANSATNGASYKEEIKSNQDVDLKNFISKRDANSRIYTGTTVITNGAEFNIKGYGFGYNSNDNCYNSLNVGIVGDLTIQSGSSLNLLNSGNAFSKIDGRNTANNKTSGTLTVNNSSLTFQQGVITFNNIEIHSGSTVSISGDLSKFVPNQTKWQTFSNLTADSEQNGSGFFKAKGENTFNLENGSALLARAFLFEGENTINFTGSLWADKNLADGDKQVTGEQYATSIIRSYSITNGVKFVANKNPTNLSTDFNPDKTKWLKPTINVADGKAGAIYAKYTKLDGVDVNIGKDATFILDGDFIGGENTFADSHHQATTVTLSDVTVNNSGTLVLGSKHNTDQSNTYISNTDLTNNALNDTVITGTIENNSALVIGDKSSLTVDEANIFVTKSGEQITSTNGLFANGKGSVTLNKGSTLVLANGDLEKGLDLNKDVSFSNTVKDSGNINVAGTATLQGGYLKVNAPLKNVAINRLAIAADKLELGDGTKDSVDSLSKYKLNGLKVVGAKKAELILNGNEGSVFNVDKTIKAYFQDYFIKSDDECITYEVNPLIGKISGDDLNVSGNGIIQILGGNWENDGQDLILNNNTSYSLAVKADADQSGDEFEGSSNIDGTLINYNTSTKPSYLTWNGTVTINNDGRVIKVEGASGANAVLDLTDAEIVWTKGRINVGAEQETLGTSLLNVINHDNQAKYGYSVLKIDDDELNDFLNVQSTEGESKVAINLKDNGVLYIDGTSSVINFSKLTGDTKFSNDKSTTTANGTIGFIQSTNPNINSFNSYLYHTGNLELVTGVDDKGNAQTEESGVSGDKLNIGQGSIYATNISIDNYSLADKASYETNQVVVAQGTLAVNESLRTDNRRIVFGDDTRDAHLVLGFDTAKLTKEDTGSVEGNLVFNKNSSLSVNDTAWVVDDNEHGLGDITLNENSSIVVSTNPVLNKKYGLTAGLTADNLASDSGSIVKVSKYSSATFNTVQANGGTFNVSGHFTVNGLKIDTIDPSAIEAEPNPAYDSRETNGINLTDATINVTGAGAVFEFSATATDGLLNNTGVLTLKEGGITGTQWSVSNFGQVKFDFANFTDKTINPDDIKVLVDNILGTSNTTGYLNLANAELGMTITDRASAPGYYEAKWTDNVELYKQVVGHATTDKLLNTVVQIEDDQAKIRGHYAALEVTDKVDNSFGKVRLDGPTSLHHSDANGGNFVSFNGDVGSVELDKDASLALFGSGTIGSIESRYKDGGDSIDWDGDVVENARGSLFISNEGDVSSSAVDVKGSIKGINRLDISTGAQVTVDENIENTNAVELADNSSLTVKGDLQSSRLNVDSSSSVQATNTQILGGLVMGKSTNNETLTLGDKNRSGDLEIYGGEVKTKDLVFSTLSGANDHRSIDVGTGINDKDFDDPDTIYNEQIGYTGSLEVTGKTTLNHRGEISVVAENTAKGGVSFASLNDLSGKDTTENYAGTLDGGLFVGQNGVAGIGVKDMASLKGELARFFDGNALTQANAQSILYLGKAFNVGQDEHVVLTSMQTEPFIEHITKNNKETNPKIDFSNCDGDFFGPNTFYMGENTAVVVAKNLADAARITSLGDAGATKAMISFVGDKVDAQGTVIADGGDIFINGDVRAAKYQVFSTNATIEYLDGTDYKIALEGEDNYANNINVTTENGFLNGFVDVDGTVALKVDPNGRAIMSGASDPVFDTIVAYARGYYGPEIADTTPPVPPTEGEDGKGTKAATESPVTPPATTAEREYIYSLDKDGNKLIGQYANYFLQETIATGEGSAAETVARLGVFGGMSQTAIAVAGTSSDAMAARMGIGGKNTQLSVADNGQGASLWVAPIYKSYNSDTFAIQSLNYGVDIDMYGLALGGDYSLGNGMKFGAMFNLGSGDTEGNGAATGTTNDFNYYGFGAFFGYSIDQFSVMADASYTIVDNDLEANTSIEKVSSSADASTYSIGVTAQYTIDMAGFEIAPHIGARYSSIDLDDYIIKGASGDIALYEAEKINVFSIPVGVSFAKEIVSESWTVKPSLDLTVTVNAGDDTADGNVYWAGAENLRTTGLKSEILDSVTYGATAGFSAKSGNFSLGLGVSYTGSSNTDELGVNANARFMF